MHTTVHELRVVVAYHSRAPNRLDEPWCEDHPTPTLDALVQAVTDAREVDQWTLVGGEPTLRPDLPHLVSAMTDAGAPRLVLRTDGLALTRSSAVERLTEAGLTGIRIPFCTGRTDAQDWLMGLPGASRTARKALDCWRIAGLQVEAEVVITRPTMPYLNETVALLKRSGVQALRFRLLQKTGAAKGDYITLAPRIALLQPYLEDALHTALQQDMAVHVEGIPRCVFTRYPECACPTDAISWAIPGGAHLHPDFTRPTDPSRCQGCPGTPECPGVPAAYSTRFGWTELASEGLEQRSPATPLVVPLPASGDAIVPPPSREGRHPSTRVSAAHQQAHRPSLGGDPLAGRAPLPEQPDAFGFQFEAGESTRAIRQRLVQCAQHGAQTLRIEGASLAHPAAVPLLRECLRLSFAHVEVYGAAHHLSECSDTELFQLRGLSKFVMVLHSSDDDAHDGATGQAGSLQASVAVGQRLARLAKVTVEVAPGEPSDGLREELAAAWASGRLPPVTEAPRVVPRWTDHPTDFDAQPPESR